MYALYVSCLCFIVISGRVITAVGNVMITAVQWGDHNSVITAVYDGVIKKVITVG